MSKTVTLEGKTYTVPDDASLDEIDSLISGSNTTKSPPDTSHWTGLGQAYAESANPLPTDLLRSIYEHGNIETLKRIGVAQGSLFQKAQAAYHAGNYLEAARHTVGWLLPLAGPLIDQAGDEAQRGEYGKALGHVLGLGTQVAVPAALSHITNIPLSPGTKLTPEMQAANIAADTEKIPLGLAVRSGNEAAASAENILAKQPAAAAVIKASRERTATGLKAAIDRQASQITPTPATPETAGAGVRSTLESNTKAFDALADSAYSKLRQIEADPVNTKSVQIGTQTQPQMTFNAQGHSSVQPVSSPVMADVAMPVDLRPVKAALKPIYDQVKKAMPLAQQEASPGLTAIKQVLDSDDHVSASTADRNLSKLKGIVRGADAPYLRDVSQGLAAKTVGELSDAVDTAVQTAGPDAELALSRGRALTRRKWDLVDLQKDLREEPVRLFDQITARKDTAINTLREVASKAPASIPKVARGYIQGLMDNASNTDGSFDFSKAATAYEKLGDSTKKVLFQDPARIQALDNLFQLSRRLGRTPNPSGSAATYATVSAGQLILEHPVTGTLFTVSLNPLSRLLMNPSFARAITKGLSVSGKSAAAASAATTALAIAGKDAQEVKQPNP